MYEDYARTQKTSAHFCAPAATRATSPRKGRTLSDFIEATRRFLTGFPRRYGKKHRQSCPTRLRPGTLAAMENRCEVCENFHPGAEFGGRYRVVEVEFDMRRVHLCVGHKKIAENSGVTSFEELRALYGTGRRSFVPRRGNSSAIAGDKRQGRGRRVSDR